MLYIFPLEHDTQPKIPTLFWQYYDSQMTEASGKGKEDVYNNKQNTRDRRGPLDPTNTR